LGFAELSCRAFEIAGDEVGLKVSSARELLD
jgi:hypothetical protein